VTMIDDAQSSNEDGNGGIKAVAISGYMFCSALMLIANKLAVFHIPVPTFVLLCQLAGTALVVGVSGSLGYANVGALTTEKFKKFFLVPLTFLATIFSNIKILQFSNVETFIVFRASTPLFISVADFVFLGRTLPSLRSALCLAMLLLGTVGYVLSEDYDDDKRTAYIWVLAWYMVFSFDQIYIKHMCDSVPMTTWGRVLYTNATASIPLFLIFVVTGDYSRVFGTDTVAFAWSTHACVWLVVSILIGCSIAYFSFLARAHLSATYFTVVGNSCKILTVFINRMMWSHHATPVGMGCVAVCLLAAYLYEPAPIREKKSTKVYLI